LVPLPHEEIKQAGFSRDNSKVSGINGYTAGFFKTASPTTGKAIFDAVLVFFNNGKLLWQINSTLITLIAKKPNASNVCDFRPIALCNVLFKIITKVLA